MRDDISGLFDKLILVYAEKLNLLKKINTSQVQQKHLLQSGQVKKLDDIIRSDNEIFISIDSLEYDLRSIVNTICEKTGIKISRFKEYFFNRKERPIPELKRLYMEINELASSIIEYREGLISKMEKTSEEIEKDIYSLKKIRELNFTF